MSSLLFETAMGPCLIGFSGRGISSIDLFVEGGPGDERGGAASEDDPGRDNALDASRLLVRYFQGEDANFSTIRLDLEGCSDFFRRVCNIVRIIPYGSLASYGGVARMAERPGSARAVGRVMANNSIPIVIPCHRVVASDGRLTGYSAEGGLATKEKLLRMEGLRFSDSGRVELL